MESNEVMPPPPSLSAKYEGSFAYLTVRDRLPTILTKVIDTIHRNKSKFFEEHGEEGVEAEKRVISFLSKLRNELQTDKPLLALTDEMDDTEAWNQYMKRHEALQGEKEPVSWFKSPWLYVECYMYRRIHEAFMFNPLISNFDAFKEGKTQSFFESQPAIIALCTHLQDILKNIDDASEAELLDQFLKLLQVSLWGNKCDLSISAGQENSQKASPFDSLPDLRRFILVDDSNMVWSTLMSAGGSDWSVKSSARVDIVLDNAGFELLTDLVLAHYLVSAGLVREVRFHGKSMPWFVSDVTKQDFEWTIMQTTASNHKLMSMSGAQWKRFMKEGVWSYHDHPFWTQPHEFCDMASVSPDLYRTLQASNLILFKGDLNYRKLTSDRYWDHSVAFNKALRGFQPAPLCSIRTLKANVQVGLQPGHAENLSSKDPDWMTNGKYGVVQFSSPQQEQLA